MTTPPKPRSKPEILSQTAYRGIGVIIVMLAHFYLVRSGPNEAIGPVQMYPNLGMAIDLFFIISGYIMAYIYADGFAQTITKKGVGTFLWARFIRTYPLHIFALLVFLAERGAQVYLSSAGGGLLNQAGAVPFFDAEDSPFALLTQVLMVHAWGLNHALAWNFPSWALSAEFAAYLTFPFLCLLIGRFRWIGSAILIVGAFTAYVFIDRAFGTLNVPGYIGAIKCIPGFAFGVALHSLMSLPGESPVSRLSTAQLHVLQAAALAAVLVLGNVAEHQMFIIAAIGVLVLVTSENRGWLCDLLSWSPLLYLGRISYSVYQMHIVAALAVSPFLRIIGARTGLGDAWWWLSFEVLAKMAAAIAVSALTYRFIELPGRYLFKKRKPKPARAAAEAIPVPAIEGATVLAQAEQAGAQATTATALPGRSGIN
jgi:peptidoglycan/LPS O-acetylase OafA/YrhL